MPVCRDFQVTGIPIRQRLSSAILPVAVLATVVSLSACRTDAGPMPRQQAQQPVSLTQADRARLVEILYNAGFIDSVDGPNLNDRFLTAVLDVQLANEIYPTGIVDERTLRAIVALENPNDPSPNGALSQAFAPQPTRPLAHAQGSSRSPAPLGMCPDGALPTSAGDCVPALPGPTSDRQVGTLVGMETEQGQPTVVIGGESTGAPTIVGETALEGAAPSATNPIDPRLLMTAPTDGPERTTGSASTVGRPRTPSTNLDPDMVALPEPQADELISIDNATDPQEAAFPPPPPAEPSPIPTPGSSLAIGQRILALETVDCRPPHEAFTLIFTGEILDVVDDTYTVRLDERFAVWFDHRRDGVFVGEWWCNPPRRFCYEAVSFADWGGDRTAGMTMSVNADIMLSVGDDEQAAITRFVEGQVENRCTFG